MITLKELIDMQKLKGEYETKDIQIIQAFFELNNLEEDAIDLISQLTKSKINKIKKKYKMAETWVCLLPSKYLYEHYDLDIAEHLHKLELDFLMNGGKLSLSRFEWAKENIPNIKMPQVYFAPLISWLEDREIKFKNN